MNSSIYRFSLDMHSAQSQISIPVLLGDTSREWQITLSDGGRSYIIKDGCLAKITIKRPTGTHLEEFCAIEDNTTIVYSFAQNENTAAVEGIHDCDITLYGLDGRRIASAKFTMVVSERVISDDDIVLTDNDMTAVDAMLNKEAERQASEVQRVNAETQRAEAETQRVESENHRTESETQRKASEVQRAEAEEERQTAESERNAAELIRKSNEDVRVSKDAEREASVKNAVNASGRAEVMATTALETANRAAEDVSDFREEIGSESLIEGQKTVKSAVNHAVSTANTAKNQSEVTRNNLVNLSAQVQGIGRSYVVRTFAEFLDFMRSAKFVELKEDRDGDGVDETYKVYVSDLKTGDNILIVEDGVPDFWFEKNSALSEFETYTYNDTEYSLSATATGVTIGGAHILETDYTVIEGYSVSASASAQAASVSALEAKEAKEAAETAQSEAERAKSLSVAEAEQSKAYAEEAKATAQQMANDTRNMDARITRNEKHITNLLQGITPDPFEVDDSVAYAKIVPTNALPYAAVQKVGGMTHKSRNLAKLDAIFEWGVSTSFADDGKITLTTNNAYPSQYGTVAKASLKANTTYVISMSGCSNITTMYVWVAGTTSQLGVAYPSFPASYTPTQDIDVELAVYVKDNSPVGTISSCYIMVNEGSTALPYEPYFEGLRDAKVTEIKSVGANVLPTPLTEATVIEGITYTPNPDGSFAVNGTATADSQLRITCDEFVGGTFTLSGLSQTGANDTWFMRIVDHTATSLGNCIGTKTYNIPQGKTQWIFRVKAGTTVNNLVVSPMLNRGSTAAPYRPYREPISSILGAVQSIDGYGRGVNESVYNYIDLENKTFVQSVKTITLVGTEKIVSSSRSNCFNLTSPIDATTSLHLRNDVPYVCSHYTAVHYNDRADKTVYMFTGGENTIQFWDTDFATVEDFKAHLAELYASGNPVKIVYPLATPTVTDISDLLGDDNLIEVESGGAIVFENEYGYDVPSEIVYQLKEVMA